MVDTTEHVIDKFVSMHVSCMSCAFFQADLFGGGVCEGPELPLGYMEIGDSMCEQHEFWDDSLERQLEELQEAWIDELIACGAIPQLEQAQGQ